jgi:hypothetical protein
MALPVRISKQKTTINMFFTTTPLHQPYFVGAILADQGGQRGGRLAATGRTR